MAGGAAISPSFTIAMAGGAAISPSSTTAMAGGAAISLSSIAAMTGSAGIFIFTGFIGFVSSSNRRPLRGGRRVFFTCLIYSSNEDCSFFVHFLGSALPYVSCGVVMFSTTLPKFGQKGVFFEFFHYQVAKCFCVPFVSLPPFLSDASSQEEGNNPSSEGFTCPGTMMEGETEYTGGASFARTNGPTEEGQDQLERREEGKEGDPLAWTREPSQTAQSDGYLMTRAGRRVRSARDPDFAYSF